MAKRLLATPWAEHLDLESMLGMRRCAFPGVGVLSLRAPPRQRSPWAAALPYPPHLSGRSPGAGGRLTALQGLGIVQPHVPRHGHAGFRRSERDAIVRELGEARQQIRCDEDLGRKESGVGGTGGRQYAAHHISPRNVRAAESSVREALCHGMIIGGGFAGSIADICGGIDAKEGGRPHQL